MEASCRRHQIRIEQTKPSLVWKARCSVQALNNELQTVKRKAADTVEQVYEGSQKKQRKTTTSPKKVKKTTTTTKKVKKEGDFFG